MHPEVFAVLAREHRREILLEFERSRSRRPIVRRLVARLLRHCGDGLFRLGVRLDDVRV
jgi:hypothetical protein